MTPQDVLQRLEALDIASVLRSAPLGPVQVTCLTYLPPLVAVARAALDWMDADNIEVAKTRWAEQDAALVRLEAALAALGEEASHG